jgi:EAL domain-containing protein (putative c-di-GMP-specific phosphodiesterase class I)
MGVDFAQGHIVGKPVEIQDVLTALADNVGTAAAS